MKPLTNLKGSKMRTLLTLAVGITAGAIIQASIQAQPLPTPAPEVVRTVMDLPATSTETWNVSAYCACEKCCGEYSKGLHYRQTANGYRIKPGDKLVAAPPNIPFGTWIDIPGYGKVQVKDRGGAIKGNRLDVYFSTHSEALRWGRQHLPVTF